MSTSDTPRPVTYQGRTVDTALLLIDTPTDDPAIYTPLTRGRHSNHAFVAIDENRLVQMFSPITQEWADQRAIARRAELAKELGRTIPEQEQTLERTGTSGLEQSPPVRARKRTSISLER